MHLLDKGHRDIIHVTHPYSESIRRRVDGFRNAIEETGIYFNPSRHILDLGRIGVELLARHLSDPAALVQRITVGVDLVLRDSTTEPSRTAH